MKIKEIKETRSGKIAEMRSISDKAATENRDLSGEERKRFDTLDTEVTGLSARLNDAEKMVEFERLEARGDTVSGDSSERRSLDHYSLSKAVSESRNGALTGLEAEWHQELAKDRAEVRGVMVPTEIILGGERRALTTGGSASNMVSTDLAAMTDRRRAALMVERMGAMVLRTLRAISNFPACQRPGAPAGLRSTQTPRVPTRPLPKRAWAPRQLLRNMNCRAGCCCKAIKHLSRSCGPIWPTCWRRRLTALRFREAVRMNRLGSLETGCCSVTGGAFDSDITADLIAALQTDNVTGTTGFLTNPAVMNAARKTKDADGRVIPLAELFHNERAESSTQVPGDIGAESDKNALIYGEWASLYIGYWSGVDLLMNPYHSDVASKGGAILHAFLDADVVVRHPEGFRYAEID